MLCRLREKIRWLLSSRYRREKRERERFFRLLIERGSLLLDEGQIIDIPRVERLTSAEP